MNGQMVTATGQALWPKDLAHGQPNGAKTNLRKEALRVPRHHMTKTRRLRRAAAAATVSILVGALAGVQSITALAQTAATVSVSPSSTLATVGPNAYGVNTAVYDGNMTDQATIAPRQAAGISALRFPGGSYGDI